MAHRLDVVMRLVERRADQIVHRRIDDDEALVAFLHILDRGDEDAGIAHDQPARLEHQFDTELATDACVTILA